jgi:hypothetical protein
VADYLDSSSNYRKWNVSFIRNARNWDADIFASFFNL